MKEMSVHSATTIPLHIHSLPTPKIFSPPAGSNMALSAFPPGTTPSSATVSVTVPNLTMPPQIDVTPPPSPPSPPPETVTNSSSPPPLASPSSSLHPKSTPSSPPPLSSPPATMPLPPSLPQIPPVSDITPPPLPPDPSPLPPSPPATAVPSSPLPPSPPATAVPSLPSPTTSSQPPSLPKETSPSTPAIINNPPPRHSTPSPISAASSPVTNSPRRHHRTRTLPSTDPKTPTTTPSPSHPVPPTPRNPNTISQPQEPKTRVHEHPPFPPAADQTSPPPGNIPESEMPLIPHSSAPDPGQPLLSGGGGAVIGSQPASSVLPIGVDMGPDLAGRGGGKSPSSSTARVPAGVVVGLGVGGVILVLLLVFGILVVFSRRRGLSGGGSGICKGDTDGGKSSLPRYSKQSRTSDSEYRLIYPKQQPPPSVVTNQPATSTVNLRNSALDSNNQAMAMALGAFSVGSTFTYEELSAATGGFSDSNLLGQGGFGYVYKGVLPNGKEVAVKQLKLGGHQGEREFQAEVETISQVHHKHLVSLVGYCIAGAERLLVYDFVPNNTLDFHLHGKDQEVMPWSRRLKIAIGSGKGLAYLHEDCNPTIIHRDIKAANILLDFNCEAKVSDFGLAKIFSNTSESHIVTHITTRVVGTFGYLAPEYASSGKVTDKSDVYSYGVMLLELITGRPPINLTAGSEEMNGSLVNWARPLLAQAIEEGDFQTLVDPRLENKYNQNEMASMVACAAACIRLSAWRRPRMCQVVRALEGDLSPSNLDDGVRPGQSSTHYSYDSSLEFDARKYMEEMKRFKMELASSGGDSHNNMTDQQRVWA